MATFFGSFEGEVFLNIPMCFRMVEPKILVVYQFLLFALVFSFGSA